MRQSTLFPRQIGRLSYLVRYLLAIMIGGVGSLFIEFGQTLDTPAKLVSILVGAHILLFFLYYLFRHVLIARLRDLDLHAALALLILVPFANFLFAFYLLLAPSRSPVPPVAADPTRSGLAKPVKFIGLGCAGAFCVGVIALLVIGSVAVETHVYTGDEIPERFLRTIRSLDLLEDNEQIRYFYSDGFIDIETGFYMVTDRNLVLYSAAWEEPEMIIPCGQIVSLDVQHDDSFLVDTMVCLTTYSGMEVAFPVSSESGLDVKFVEAIREHMDVESAGGE